MDLGMGISVENFMASQIESGRRSKLEPFKDDILLLKKKWVFPKTDSAVFSAKRYSCRAYYDKLVHPFPAAKSGFSS